MLHRVHVQNIFFFFVELLIKIGGLQILALLTIFMRSIRIGSHQWTVILILISFFLLARFSQSWWMVTSNGLSHVSFKFSWWNDKSRQICPNCEKCMFFSSNFKSWMLRINHALKCFIYKQISVLNDKIKQMMISSRDLNKTFFLNNRKMHQIYEILTTMRHIEQLGRQAIHIAMHHVKVKWPFEFFSFVSFFF